MPPVSGLPEFHGGGHLAQDRLGAEGVSWLFMQRAEQITVSLAFALSYFFSFAVLKQYHVNHLDLPR